MTIKQFLCFSEHSSHEKSIKNLDSMKNANVLPSEKYNEFVSVWIFIGNSAGIKSLLVWIHYIQQ